MIPELDETFPIEGLWDKAKPPTKAHIQEYKNLHEAVGAFLREADRAAHGGENLAEVSATMENMKGVWMRGFIMPEIRVINATGEPTLYDPENPASKFRVVEGSKP